MKEKIKYFLSQYKYSFYFFLICLFISGVFLNQKCIPNEYTDYDYGPFPGEPEYICETEGSISKIFLKAVGLFFWGYVAWDILNEFEKKKKKQNDK
jgi:hypothetical protein